MDTWVSDRLHDILGISDKHITQFLIALAKKATSAADYIEKLQDTGTVDIDAQMTSFAQELWNRVSNM